MRATPGRRSALIIVENCHVPFDRRVWHEATTLQAAGYRVSVISPMAPGFTTRREVIDDVTVYRHPTTTWGSGQRALVLEYLNALLWESALAVRILLTDGFDVIHACNPPDTTFLIARCFKLLGKGFIFDHHDLSPELYEAKFRRRGVVWRRLLALEQMTFRAADLSIATNESYRKVAIERGGMDPADVYVVRNGPDPEVVRPVPPRPELKRGRPYLVAYVGQLGSQEGMDYLLDAACHIVRDLRRDVQFAIVGTGPERRRLQARARELELSDYVTFTGFIPDDEMIAVLSTADVCVNPDEHNQMNDLSTMIKVLEYMALGKPIVQFDVHEGRVSAQTASLYARPNDAVDFGDKIVSLLDDPERRAAMGAFGRRRVETELSWAHQAPNLLAAYDHLWERAAQRNVRKREARARDRARWTSRIDAVRSRSRSRCGSPPSRSFSLSNRAVDNDASCR